MTILVTGATGRIGALVAERLAGEKVELRALVRDASKARAPEGAAPVEGDMTEPDTLRAAFEGVDTLFLINAVVADETTQALTALDLACEAGISRIVYLSVFNGALFSDVPHFAGKHLVERAIDDRQIPATVLRPAYFMQNDLALKDAILSGAYPQPIGGVGLAMVDARDIAEAAAVELLRRERSPAPLPRTTIELVGPDTLTGEDVASIWASTLGRDVAYGGDDLAAFETQAAQAMPGWQAHDLRVMMRAFHRHGMVPGDDARAVFEALIGHPARSYRDFANEAVADWR